MNPGQSSRPESRRHALTKSGQNPPFPPPPAAGFWTTVALVAVLVTYPLSFGPACWMVRSGLISPATAAHAYRPILRDSGLLPSRVHRAIVTYAGHNESGSGTFVHSNLVLLGESLNR
jgi:hypothetical protein